jgi:hypothetical protein
MIRTMGFVAMAGGFLIISPGMRQGGFEAGLKMAAYLDNHSPYSYIAIAAAMAGMLILLARSAGVKH